MPMSTQDNKAVVLDYVSAFNRGDLDGVCRQFAPGALVYGVLGFGGLDKARPIWEQLITCSTKSSTSSSLAWGYSRSATATTAQGRRSSSRQAALPIAEARA
jgi:hypothetical protein